MQVETCCTRLAENTGHIKSLSVQHRTPLLGYIFANKALIDNPKKNLLNSNISSTCPHSMVNYGPLGAEIGSVVWDTSVTVNFNWFHVLAQVGSITARHSSNGCQPNFATLNRGRHLYSAVRPSCWALAHILVAYNFAVIKTPLMPFQILCDGSNNALLTCTRAV